MKRLVLYCLASLSLALPAFASATDAYVTGNVNMRAGPDSSYPLIDQIPAGSEVDVQGCTQGWEWCDVISADNRGWIAGNFIEYEYQDQPVLLPSYGAQIGIPIVSFVIASYWDNYYRSRPFYRQRTVWYRRPYVRRPPPRPLPHPVRPGRPGMGRPPVNRPGHGYRPSPSRPGNHQRPTPRPAQARPMPEARPGGNMQRPPMQRPAISQPRPAAPAARPAARPAAPRPGGMSRPANRPAPAAKGGNARPKEGDKKDEHGHRGN